MSSALDICVKRVNKEIDKAAIWLRNKKHITISENVWSFEIKANIKIHIWYNFW